MDAVDHRTAEPTFRTAVATDVPALVGLIESAYRGDASRAGWTTEADLLEGQRTDPEGVAAVVANSASRMLVVELDGELAACCQLEQRPGAAGGAAGPTGVTGATGDNAYFGMFAVRPELQGAGLGKVILTEAERLVRAEWDAREMHMTVISAREDLIAWYVRRGYVRTGTMTPFPYGDERFGIPQRTDLAFELLVKPLAGPAARDSAA
ncbi:GNAT family N-acetyltransferase [Streptomyces sp. H27-D2]|uniref:GNAT family N-acetyltransferase n=1 Tax=Streptomyces sp. H27-D2 TaxID=3046304 RepID=UPI002DBB5289|nr:GNAT family N-acetyltransferase [Streptomyces sp. H27-D2]MEC4019086.1 GNAT family N-acetyltransferase [Streptomyces sp. H27-D2]